MAIHSHAPEIAAVEQSYLMLQLVKGDKIDREKKKKQKGKSTFTQRKIQMSLSHWKRWKLNCTIVIIMII